MKSRSSVLLLVGDKHHEQIYGEGAGKGRLKKKIGKKKEHYRNKRRMTVARIKPNTVVSDADGRSGAL